MNIVPEPLSLASRLAQDYIHHFDRVSGFYGEDYRGEHSFAERVQWLDLSEDKRIQRKALADCLRTYNKKHNDHPAVHKSLQLLEHQERLRWLVDNKAVCSLDPACHI